MKTPGTTEAKTVATGSKGYAKRTKVARSVDSGLGAPSFATRSSLSAERDELKCRCEELMLENQCTLDPAEEAKQLLAMVANIEKTNVFATVNTVKGRGTKRATVAVKHVTAL